MTLTKSSNAEDTGSVGTPTMPTCTSKANAQATAGDGLADAVSGGRLRLKVNRDQKRRGPPVELHVSGLHGDQQPPAALEACAEVRETGQGSDSSDYPQGTGTKHPRGDRGDQPLHAWMGRLLSTRPVSNSPFDLLDQWMRRRLRKILWEQWRKPKTRCRKLMALGLEAERARKATATGRGAWWNAGASHMHAAVNNRVLAEWGLRSLLDQLRAMQRST